MLLRSLFTGRAFIPHLVEGWGILPDTYVKDTIPLKKNVYSMQYQPINYK
jgi:hypothetical protein